MRTNAESTCASQRQELHCAAIETRPLHAVVVPGGGLTEAGKSPAWVLERLKRAASIYFSATADARPKIIVLSGGTPHKPMPRDAAGFQVTEAQANAHSLVHQLHVPPTDVWEENWSLDTIGNAYMLRTVHTDIGAIRRLTIVNNYFHIDRTRAIFEKVFGLLPLCATYHLQFEAVDDLGLDQAVIESRKAREAKSIRSFAHNTAELHTLHDFHAWLFSNHSAYASKRLIEERKPIDPAALKSY